MMNFDPMNKLAEGKTKIIYKNADDPSTVYMYFKDDITAGDGVKHDVIEGKALIDWRTNRDIFEFLNRAGVRTHYIDSPQERIALVKKLDWKINLEVVTRRVAAGSIVKWANAEEGTRYEPVITQFHYKDDLLHDPMLDEAYVDYLIGAKGAAEYKQMRELNAQILLCLERAFAHFNIQLVDIKLEYGVIGGQVYVIDEITGGSFRLWPYRHECPNFDQPNVLGELNPEARLDKDTYRIGEGLGTVLEKFEAIAEITGQFSAIRLNL